MRHIAHEHLALLLVRVDGIGHRVEGGPEPGDLVGPSRDPCSSISPDAIRCAAWINDPIGLNRRTRLDRGAGERDGEYDEGEQPQFAPAGGDPPASFGKLGPGQMEQC